MSIANSDSQPCCAENLGPGVRAVIAPKPNAQVKERQAVAFDCESGLDGEVPIIALRLTSNEVLLISRLAFPLQANLAYHSTL